MTQFMCALAARLHSDRRGVTALEYGVIAAAVVLAVVAGIAGLKDNVTTIFSDIAAKVIP